MQAGLCRAFISQGHRQVYVEQINPVGQAWAAATVMALSSGCGSQSKTHMVFLHNSRESDGSGQRRRAGRAVACAVGRPSLTRCQYFSGHESPLWPWPASPGLWSLEGEVREHGSWKC